MCPLPSQPGVGQLGNNNNTDVSAGKGLIHPRMRALLGICTGMSLPSVLFTGKYTSSFPFLLPEVHDSSVLTEKKCGKCEESV